MTAGGDDALFGPDGTGDAGGPGPVDGVGPLPGLDLPFVRLPTIGLDGEITGLDVFDSDLGGGVVLGSAGPVAAPSTAGGAGPSVPPGRGDPVRGDSVEGGPAQGGPAEGGPVRAGPVRGDPGWGDPARSAERPPAGGPAAGPHGPMVAVPGPVAASGPAGRPESMINHSARPAGRPGPPRIWPPTRPRVVDEPSILGFSRHSRSRLGSRLFTLFFVVVFGVILIQTIVALLDP